MLKEQPIKLQHRKICIDFPYEPLYREFYSTPRKSNLVIFVCQPLHLKSILESAVNHYKAFVSRVGVFVDDVGRRDVDVLPLRRSWFRKELWFLLL